MSRGEQWDPEPGGYPPQGGYRRPRSGGNTTVAALNFVVGGLSIVCGILTFVGVAALAALARDMGGGGLVGILATLAVVFAILFLAVGAGGIAAGVGVLNLRSWGRTLTFILAPICILIAIRALLGVLNGQAANLVAVAIYLGYAITVLVLLLNPQNAREFS